MTLPFHCYISDAIYRREIMPPPDYNYSTLEVDPRQHAEALSGGNAQAYTPDLTNDKYTVVQAADVRPSDGRKPP